MLPEIQIGTRDSELAVWQARQVMEYLKKEGIPSKLVLVKTAGDLNPGNSLFASGNTGIFTRALDAALIHGEIDLAVHSLKDVPTLPESGITQAAVLARGMVADVLVYRGSTAFLDHPELPVRIATGSPRRKAQWLHHYPGHIIEPVRGNVRTRLDKLRNGSWDGAIFAAAGLDRLNIRDVSMITLGWMLPAPAQGAIAVMCREGDRDILDCCSSFNDELTLQCVSREREFLNILEGGCSAPVGAWCQPENAMMHFRGNIFSPDGSEKLEVSLTAKITESASLGRDAAAELLQNGAGRILEQIKYAPR